MLSLRQNKRYCRVGGHAPPQRHLERSVATTKTRLTGRKQNKRKRILLSSRHTLKISSFPGHAPGKDTLRAANAATKEGANGGENARASVLRSEGVCSSVKKPRTRRRKRGLRGENNRTSFLRSKVVVFPSNNIRTPTCLRSHPPRRP